MGRLLGYSAVLELRQLCRYGTVRDTFLSCARYTKGTEIQASTSRSLKNSWPRVKHGSSEESA